MTRLTRGGSLTQYKNRGEGSGAGPVMYCGEEMVAGLIGCFSGSRLAAPERPDARWMQPTAASVAIVHTAMRSAACHRSAVAGVSGLQRTRCDPIAAVVRQQVYTLQPNCGAKPIKVGGRFLAAESILNERRRGVDSERRRGVHSE